jgi:hypothetical protein
MRLVVSLCNWPYLSLSAPRAPPRQLIKAPGVGIMMVPERIQYGPRLSPIRCRVLQGNPPWACLRIRHKLLHPVSAMGFPATGPPDRQSAIPHPWATLACWFRTTSLVYLFGISPTVAPGELQDCHIHPLCLIFW